MLTACLVLGALAFYGAALLCGALLRKRRRGAALNRCADPKCAQPTA